MGDKNGANRTELPVQNGCNRLYQRIWDCNEGDSANSHASPE